MLLRERSAQNIEIPDLTEVHSSSRKSLFVDDSSKKKRIVVDKKRKEEEAAARNAENVKNKVELDLFSTGAGSIATKLEYLVLGKKLLSSFESNSKLFLKNSVHLILI